METINCIRLKLLRPWFMAIHICCLLAFLFVSFFLLFSFFFFVFAKVFFHLNWLQNFQINRNYLAALISFFHSTTLNFCNFVMSPQSARGKKREERKEKNSIHSPRTFQLSYISFSLAAWQSLPILSYPPWTGHRPRPCKCGRNACGAICGNVWARRNAIG